MSKKLAFQNMVGKLLEYVHDENKTTYMSRPLPSTEALSFEFVEYEGGIPPFWAVNIEDVPYGDEPFPLTDAGPWRCLVWRLLKPMNYCLRNVGWDEVFFCHDGSCVFETDQGVISIDQGQFIYMPRGVTYRITPTQGESKLLIYQSEDKLEVPEEVCKYVPIYYPKVSHHGQSPPQGYPSVWEERIVSRDWKLVVKRDYDPLLVDRVHGDYRVSVIDTRDIPLVRGGKDAETPLEIATCRHFNLEASKRRIPLPMYEKNILHDELNFTHAAGRKSAKGLTRTELGNFVHTPGTFRLIPRGIAHATTSSARVAAADERFQCGAVIAESKPPVRLTKDAVKVLGNRIRRLTEKDFEAEKLLDELSRLPQALR